MASIINATTSTGVSVTGDNSGVLQLATNNGTTAVTIDTNQTVNFVGGRVTKPLQPAFMARTYSGNGTVNGAYTSVLFGNIDINRGNHFNNTNGIFTCPVAGDYYVYFNYNIRATAADWTSAFILRNSSNVINSWAQPSTDNQYDNVLVSCVLNCAANDTITLAYHNSYSVPSTSALYIHASIYLLG